MCGIRKTVFIHEQHVPVALEWDTSDANCLHVLATDLTKRPIGTARLLQDGYIGRMAVLKEWRRMGVGKSLLQRLLIEAKKQQMRKVIIHAQSHAVGFYIGFGFQIVGKEFIDANILHIKMTLQL